MAEVGRAATAQRLEIQQANELVNALLAKYEHLFQRGAAENPGLPFEQVYDLRTLRPGPAWQQTYEETKAAVRGMGLACV